MAHDTANLYFSFWAIFSLLPPFSLLTDQKTKIKKMKKKNTWRYRHILHMCTKNYDHMIYGS